MVDQRYHRGHHCTLPPVPQRPIAKADGGDHAFVAFLALCRALPAIHESVCRWAVAEGGVGRDWGVAGQWWLAVCVVVIAIVFFTLPTILPGPVHEAFGFGFAPCACDALGFALATVPVITSSEIEIGLGGGFAENLRRKVLCESDKSLAGGGVGTRPWCWWGRGGGGLGVALDHSVRWRIRYSPKHTSTQSSQQTNSVDGTSTQVILSTSPPRHNKHGVVSRVVCVTDIDKWTEQM